MRTRRPRRPRARQARSSSSIGVQRHPPTAFESPSTPSATNSSRGDAQLLRIEPGLRHRLRALARQYDQDSGRPIGQQPRQALPLSGTASKDLLVIEQYESTDEIMLWKD